MICKSLNSLTSRIQALPDEILVKQNKKNILTAVQLALHYYFVFGLSRTWEKRPREAPSGPFLLISLQKMIDSTHEWIPS